MNIKQPAQATCLVSCPLTGTQYAMPAPYASGSLSFTSLHPMLTAQLAPSQALKLGAEWLLWIQAYKLVKLGGLVVQAPISSKLIAKAGSSKLHKCLELAESVASTQAWRKKYPCYRFTEHSSIESLTVWLEEVWSLQKGVDGLRFESSEERAASSKLDDALRVQAKRKKQLGVKHSIQVVCSYMEDLEHTTGWKQQHSEWCSQSASKMIPSMGILKLLVQKLADGFPDASLVGAQVAALAEQVSQHLCTVLLQQAHSTLECALSREEELEAASTIQSLQEELGSKYEGLGLTSKIGYAVLPASSEVGSKQAQAVASKLETALNTAPVVHKLQATPQKLNTMQAKMAALLAAKGNA